MELFKKKQLEICEIRELSVALSTNNEFLTL